MFISNKYNISIKTIYYNNIMSFDKNITCEKQKEDIDSFTPDYYFYTDGACSNNGKYNALAGIGIFFGIGDNRRLKCYKV